MRTRRAHQKSRNGCLTCKKRRVKCDERGPPCDNCKNKSLDCSFAEPSRRNDAGTLMKSSTPQPEQSQDRRKLASGFRYFELELMHQWSVSTYRSMCGDYAAGLNIWQTLMPREALKFDYMLNSMLALAALEIAMTAKDKQKSTYVEKAVELQDLASHTFRSEIRDVSDITEENHLAVFVFSCFVVVYSIAVPQLDSSSVTDSITFHYDLLRGIAPVSIHTLGWLQKGPLKEHIDLTDLPGAESVEKLDSNTKNALHRLEALNEVQKASPEDISLSPNEAGSSTHIACRTAIRYLKWLFAVCPEPKLRGLSLAFLNFAGSDYVEAVKSSNSIALLLLMHWGVLAQRVGYDIWWAESLGEKLVDELSTVLKADEIPEVKACVLWARQEVGLETKDSGS